MKKLALERRKGFVDPLLKKKDEKIEEKTEEVDSSENKEFKYRPNVDTFAYEELKVIKICKCKK